MANPVPSASVSKVYVPVKSDVVAYMIYIGQKRLLLQSGNHPYREKWTMRTQCREHSQFLLLGEICIVPVQIHGDMHLIGSDLFTKGAELFAPREEFSGVGPALLRLSATL